MVLMNYVVSHVERIVRLVEITKHPVILPTEVALAVEVDIVVICVGSHAVIIA